MKLCPVCERPTNRGPNATYCAECVYARTLLRHQVGQVLLCPCGAPRTTRKFCDACVIERRQAVLIRYRRSEKGRLNQQRHTSKPATKIKRSLYADSHRDQIRGYKRKHSQKHLLTGTIRQCRTLLCTGTFVLGYRSGSRKFCDGCRLFYYGPAYLRRAA